MAIGSSAKSGIQDCLCENHVVENLQRISLEGRAFRVTTRKVLHADNNDLP